MIRLATRQDIPNLLMMVEDYCEETIIETYKNKELHDKQYAERLLEEINYGQISC